MLSQFVVGALLLVSVPMFAQTPPAGPPARPPRPGSINYLEGQATIGATPLTVGSIGTTELERDQTLVTQAGKVEILLAPGIFLRLADNSSLKMISPDLANIVVQLDKGRAMVEVLDIRKENNIQIGQNGALTRLLKKGLYDFDADRSEIRVFEGEAEVHAGNRTAKFGKERKAMLGGDLKPLRFERRQNEDDFYRWCGLRSGYLGEASVDVARTYIGSGPEFYGPGWVGFGWYWSPWFSAYTFLPPDRVYYGPFGWPFYSPFGVYYSPYIFYGHYPHRFGDFHYPYGHGFPRPGGRTGRVPGRPPRR